MKKILVIILLIASVPLFGQNQNVRQTVSGTSVLFYRGATQLDAGSGNLGWFNVTAYGAKADGTDDQPEIQAALTAGAGKTVYFPKGTYYISNILTISSNTIVKGDGWEHTKIIARTDFPRYSKPMITFNGNAENIRIEGLCIDGNSANLKPKSSINNGISSNNGTSHQDVTNVTLKGVEIKNTSGMGLYVSTGSTRWDMIDCWFHVNGDTLHSANIYFSNEGTTGGDRFINVVSDSSWEHGIYYDGGAGVQILNSSFRYNGVGSLPEDPTGTGGMGISMRADSNIIISNNIIEHNTYLGLTVQNDATDDFHNYAIRNVLINGNKIIHNRGGAASATQSQVLFDQTERLKFTNNIVGLSTGTNGTQRGIYLYTDNKDITIENNDFYSTSGINIESDSLYNITIQKNIFHKDENGHNYYCIDIDNIDGGNMVITENTGYDPITGVRINAAANGTFPGLNIKNNNWPGATNQVVNGGTMTGHNIEYKGSSAFTTTADRKAIFIDGLTTDYDATVTADQGSDAVHPVAADLMSAYCKADSLIVKRIAGTGGTSGLKFKYLVNND